jgi:hypothetical protein
MNILYKGRTREDLQAKLDDVVDSSDWFSLTYGGLTCDEHPRTVSCRQERKSFRMLGRRKLQFFY